MEVCEVVGSITSSAKDLKLIGFKLMIVKPVLSPLDTAFVAVDVVGSGVGEMVLVARGSAAREIAVTQGVPTDATIIALVDPDQSDPWLRTKRSSDTGQGVSKHG